MSVLAPDIEAHFNALVRDADAFNCERLRGEVSAHKMEIVEAAKSNGLLPVDIAEALEDALHGLIDAAFDFSADDQALVVAAAQYFISDDDPRPDTESVLGLDDDVAVFNHVVELLGQPERLLNV